MEQNSSEVENLRSLVNALYEQESKHLQNYPFRGIKEIMPYVVKGKDDFEFMKAFIFPGN
jgi:hypothetical protein